MKGFWDCWSQLKKKINLKYVNYFWVRLFTTFCSVHRALHLQLLTSLYLAVEELLLAPRQFVSRRRRPATIIYNTRDTNFIGADSVFRKVEWNKVKEYCKVNRTSWRCNPPSVPSWGGRWEWVIGLIKQLLLRRVLWINLDLHRTAFYAILVEEQEKS